MGYIQSKFLHPLGDQKRAQKHPQNLLYTRLSDFSEKLTSRIQEYVNSSLAEFEAALLSVIAMLSISIGENVSVFSAPRRLDPPSKPAANAAFDIDIQHILTAHKHISWNCKILIRSSFG